MSHLTRSSVIIKDLNALTRAAKAMGLTVNVAKRGEHVQFSGSYIGTHKAKAVFSHANGKMGVVEGEGGTYEMILDEWNNPIVNKVGRDCALLGREYTRTIVHDQVGTMGGIIASEEINTDGEIEITVSV